MFLMSVPWIAHYSSQSALGLPHNGARGPRRLNFIHDLACAGPQVLSSQRDRHSYRPPRDHPDDHLLAGVTAAGSCTISSYVRPAVNHPGGGVVAATHTEDAGSVPSF